MPVLNSVATHAGDPVNLNSTANVTLGNPLSSGTVGDNTYADTGLAILTQSAQLVEIGAGGTYDNIFYLPSGCQIMGFDVDLAVLWDNATSAVLTVGATSTGTDYIGTTGSSSSVNLKGSTGRQTITFTASGVANLWNPSNGTSLNVVPIYASIVEVGTGTASLGTVNFTIRYIQWPSTRSYNSNI